MPRHAISDTDWKRIAGLLPGKKTDPGRTARDNRLFLDAVLWIGRTGSPWRDLPEDFGKWNSIYRRFSRWSKTGVWERVFAELQDPGLEWMMIDTTIVRAHQHAAGQKK
jgi:putative transposase